MSDDATIMITDIKKALATSEKEAAQKTACLLAVGGDLNGTIFDLPIGVKTIGRSPENEISMEFQGISRKHLQISTIEQGGEQYTIIEDLGSRNGTFLNNTKLDGKAKLKKNDMIKLGSIALKFIPKGDPERLTYDKLYLEANTDGLTKAFNKAYFNHACDLEVKKSKVNGLPLSLILFDLDHFKKLNDTYGHDAGDYTLKELSKLVRSNGAREGDIFARYGGEEFCVLLPKTNLKQAFEIAERVRKLIETHPFMYDGKKLPVTASVGVADYRQGVENGTDLFKRVDMALYKSKDGGRNQVTYFRAE